jgi:uncharacterized protein YjdB
MRQTAKRSLKDWLKETNMKNSKKLTGIAIIIMAVIFSMTVIACEDFYGKDDIAVTGVSLDKRSVKIPVDQNEILTATVTPSNATNKEVIWESSYPEVATVTLGIVIGLKEGSTVITATTIDGKKTATCAVTVSPSAVAVTGVSLNKNTLPLAVGNAEKLTASIEPDNAANQRVTWSSSNTAVATVANGTVTGLTIGNATITVTTADGGYTDTCTVSVSAAVPVTGVSLNKTSASIAVNATETLTATVAPTTATNKAVTWSSANTNIATVSQDGVVTGKAAGTAVITVASVADNTKTATCTVTVSALVPVTGVSLNKTSASISVGGSETLTPTIAPSNATNKAVTWTSSNPAVASVANGTVTGLTTGSATITVSTADGGKTATCAVTVSSGGVNIPVSEVRLNKPTLSLAVNATERLTATFIPENATNKTVTWSSTNTGVATVAQDGLVTGRAAGSTTITVTSVADNTKKATCTVTINIPVTSITLKGKTGILVGGTETLKATVLPANAGMSLTWYSNTPTVATVSNDGTVTGVSAGTVYITVTDELSGRTASCEVHVSTIATPVTGVSLDKTSLTLDKGKTETLRATIQPAEATNQNITWSSSNTSIASVSQDGVVTAITGGTATITVTSVDNSSAIATCGITVPADLDFTPANLATELGKLDTTTPDKPYEIALRVSGVADFTSVRNALKGAHSKYVKLDISGSAITSIGENSLRDCPTLVEITMPSVTSIGTYAFSGCTNLVDIDIPASVRSIGNYAFSGCTKFTSVTIPGSVTSIGSSVFRGCTSLVNAYTPSIGNYMFFGCTKLTDVTFGGTNIGVGTFSGCTSLTSAPIPSGATSIGNNTFSGCTGLTSVEIPATVKSIGESAFKGCTNLISVRFDGTIPSTSFDATDSFPGNLRGVFYKTDQTNGTPKTYTWDSVGKTWN